MKTSDHCNGQVLPESNNQVENIPAVWSKLVTMNTSINENYLNENSIIQLIPVKTKEHFD